MSELVFEKRDFRRDSNYNLKTVQLNNYPIVYILYNEKKRPSAYIGQAVQATRRLKNHLEDNRRKDLKTLLHNASPFITLHLDTLDYYHNYTYLIPFYLCISSYICINNKPANQVIVPLIGGSDQYLIFQRQAQSRT